MSSITITLCGVWLASAPARPPPNSLPLRRSTSLELTAAGRSLPSSPRSFFNLRHYYSGSTPLPSGHRAKTTPPPLNFRILSCLSDLRPTHCSRFPSRLRNRFYRNARYKQTLRKREQIEIIGEWWCCPTKSAIPSMGRRGKEGDDVGSEERQKQLRGTVTNEGAASTAKTQPTLPHKGFCFRAFSKFSLGSQNCYF